MRPTLPGATVLRRLELSLAVLLAPLAVDVRAAMAVDTLAQTTPDTTVVDPDTWRFRVALYGWAPSVAGSLTARGQTVDVNASFFQIAGLNISTASSTAVKYSVAIIEAGGLYEVAKWPGSPGSFTALDGLLGFRYWNSQVDVNFDLDVAADFTRLSNLLDRNIRLNRSFGIARSDSLNWIDPVVGLRLRHQFTPSQEIMLRGDVGGFGFQSNFEWQAVGVYSYAWQLPAGGPGRLPRARRQLQQPGQQQ
jgi:hypothetical protein